jgi:iron complex outermembrane recepter protein
MNHRILLVPTLACIAGLSAAEPSAETAETITVEAGAETQSITTTKSETPPLLQPQSLGVVSSEVMHERQVVRLEDAIRQVAGVTVGGYYADWDYFRIRGFDAADSVRLDGLFSTPGIWINEETYGLERVEVLKGPGSMLYGRTSLGGMVNMVSKQPKHGDFATATLSAGTHGFGEIGIDAGTTAADDAVGLRLVAMGRNRGSFVDGVEDSTRLYVAPSLTWWAGDRTTITVLGQAIDDHINAAWPLPASGFITPNPNGTIPRERNVGEPEHQNHVDRRRLMGGYEAAHRFTETVAVRQNARVSRFESDFQGIYPGSLGTDRRTLSRNVYTYENERLDAQVDTMLDVRVDAEAMRHDLLLGLDLAHGSETAVGRFGSIASLDVIDPVYGADPGPLSPYTRLDATTRSVGVYLQDQITIARDLVVTAGLRWDRMQTESTELLTDTTTTSEDTALTWRLGAAWQFHPVASVFAGYSTAFAPQPYSRSADGEIVDPETGSQVETGLRTLDTEGRYAASVAVFQISRQDVATADEANPGFSVVTGEQRSRGFEIDGMLKPGHGFELTGTYAYIDAEVTEDNAVPVGDRLRNVPDHSATAWVTYTVPDGTLAGVGLGLGCRYYSSQAGDLPNSFELPAYTIIDAGLFYDRGPLSAQINIDNLFDEVYAVGSFNDVYVMPGEPLSVRGSISYTF